MLKQKVIKILKNTVAVKTKNLSQKIESDQKQKPISENVASTNQESHVFCTHLRYNILVEKRISYAYFLQKCKSNITHGSKGNDFIKSLFISKSEKNQQNL